MPNTRRIVIASLILATASLQGCIIVADTSTHADWPSRRIHLNSDERANLPKITSLSDLPTVERRYATQLATLTPTTTVENFKSQFPQARFVERKSVAGVNVDAYSVKLDEKFRYREADYGYLADDERWFYFRDGKYVKYARSDDWP